MYRPFEKVEKELHKVYKLQPDLSGSTLTSLVVCGNQLLCYNLGDTRAYMLSKGKGKRVIEVTQLTTTHDYQHEGDRQRILRRGGTFV